MKKATLFIFSLLFLFNYKSFAQQNADSLLQFIQSNPQKSALFLQKNDTLVASLNENKLMPLASTMKIMVAIEFAKQVSHNVYGLDSKVAISDLDKYYVPLTDGGAHPSWLQYEQGLGKIVEDSVPLLEVARGMIMFSSNANTEFLMDLLGLDNINNNYKQMGVQNYSPLYYYVSSLFLYQNPRGVKEEKILKQIRSLSEKNYRAASQMIHEQLKFNPSYKASFRPQDLTIEFQKEWSSRLPAASAAGYGRIMNVLNNRRIYSEKTYDVLTKVLEAIMENPANQKWLVHSGMKGGSTLFVLTKALYATLKNGNKIEFVYFFNHLSGEEESKLEKWMNDFEIKVLTDNSFRRKIQQAVK